MFLRNDKNMCRCSGLDVMKNDNMVILSTLLEGMLPSTILQNKQSIVHTLLCIPVYVFPSIILKVKTHVQSLDTQPGIPGQLSIYHRAEHYTTLDVYQAILLKYGFITHFSQLNKYVWLMTHKKEIG